MPHLDLSDDEAAALIKELHTIVDRDRYPLSRRIRTLRGILAKLRPEPAREPVPPPKLTRHREQQPPEGAAPAAGARPKLDQDTLAFRS
jgi:hypothetical protein